MQNDTEFLRAFNLYVAPKDKPAFLTLMQKVARGSIKDMVRELTRSKKPLSYTNIRNIQHFMSKTDAVQPVPTMKSARQQQRGRGWMGDIEQVLRDNHAPQPYLKNIVGLDIKHGWPAPNLRGYIVPPPDATKASLTVPPFLSEQQGVGQKKKKAQKQKGRGTGDPVLPRRYFDVNAPEDYYADVSHLETDYSLPSADGEFARLPMPQHGYGRSSSQQRGRSSSRSTVLPRRYFDPDAPEPYFKSVPDVEYGAGDGDQLARLPMEQHGWGMMRLLASRQGKSVQFVDASDINAVLQDMNSKRSKPIRVEDERAMKLLKDMINEKIRLLFLHYNATVHGSAPTSRKSLHELDLVRFRQVAKPWM